MGVLDRPAFTRTLLRGVALCSLVAVLSGCVAWQATQFWIAGDQIELRDNDNDDRVAGSGPQLLVIAIDGIDRHLLYRMLENGELPEMTRLLGGRGNGSGFDHAYFDRSMLSALPSSTAVSWATMITGVNPAYHGVAGNEYFVRDTGEFAAPVPVTISNASQVFKIYTEGYADKLLEAPTVYERMREREPNVRIWVGMHQYHAGADRLILTDRTTMLEAFQTLFDEHVTSPLLGGDSLSLFRELDSEVIENMDELLESEPPADVITVYLPGLDHYAHITDAPPDESRKRYLEKGLEPMMKALRETLDQAGALDDRYVILTSDHGHTGVEHDDEHSLGMDAEGEPHNVLEHAGFTVRPFTLEVDDEAFFDTVLAYQGAMAYVYVADRSTCAPGKQPCDWRKPAQRRDIEAVADAFYRNNQSGDSVPEMQGTLDMILVRRQDSDSAEHDVFEVYLGNGRSQPIADYLIDNPRPGYVALPQRMRELTSGPYGDRASDVILIAHNGDRDDSSQRYYFASLYHSWHGSPSRRDSDIPLILAHRHKDPDALRARVDAVFGGRRSERFVGELMLHLRAEQTAEAR